MPFAPKNPCPRFPCPNLRPCPVHGAANSGTHPHHSREWYAKSRAYLKQHPACETCGAPATEVDHIVPTSLGGTDDWSNLSAKCKSCHSRKTALYDGGFGRPASSAKEMT